MSYMIGSMNDAVDCKYLITKKMNNQADIGTMVHVMGVSDSGGDIVVNYRITSTGQDYVARFRSIKEFCQWARPDDFIARYYDSFSKDEIKKYIKVNSRTFATFCLPRFIIIAAAVWAVCLFLLEEILGGVLKFVIPAAVTVLTFIVVLIIYKSSKSNVKMNLYRKVGTKWGVSF